MQLLLAAAWLGVPVVMRGESNALRARPWAARLLHRLLLGLHVALVLQGGLPDQQAQQRAQAVREWLAGEGAEFPGDITWNFEKFLVGHDGRVLARFSPRTTPDDPSLIQAIEKALG